MASDAVFWTGVALSGVGAFLLLAMEEWYWLNEAQPWLIIAVLVGGLLMGGNSG